MNAERECWILGELLTNPDAFVTLENVRLINIEQDENERELLHVEGENGTKAVLQGQGFLRGGGQARKGKVGRLGRAIRGDKQDPPCACYFHEYQDQSLRRAVELDLNEPSSGGRQPNVVGWRCDARPDGFRAPVGVTPGVSGGFVEDESVGVTLRVPKEFVEVCAEFGMSPEDLIRGFVGDAAGIINFGATPRADQYGSNGSDERDMAEAWMERAYGMYREKAADPA